MIVDEVLTVETVYLRSDGIQDIEWREGTGIGMPPIEYTFKPGDRVAVQWKRFTPPGSVAQRWGGEIEWMAVNGGPAIHNKALWRAFLASERGGTAE